MCIERVCERDTFRIFLSTIRQSFLNQWDSVFNISHLHLVALLFSNMSGCRYDFWVPFNTRVQPYNASNDNTTHRVLSNSQSVLASVSKVFVPCSLQLNNSNSHLVWVLRSTTLHKLGNIFFFCFIKIIFR